MTKITLSQALEYEIAAAGWPSLISADWLQSIVARYFARKVKRKWGRYDHNNRRMADIRARYGLPSEPELSKP